MIRHGLLSQQDAERISESMQRTEDNKRRLDSLQPMDVLIIPAKFTGGANGAHAWTRQRIDATGGRYDDPLTFTGQVSGVSSMTATWQPARLPGTTGVLSGFPIYGYVTPIGLTPSTGTNYEILVAGSSGTTSGASIDNDWPIVAATVAATTTYFSGSVSDYISLDAGLYLLIGQITCTPVATMTNPHVFYLQMNTVSGTVTYYDPGPKYESFNTDGEAITITFSIPTYCGTSATIGIALTNSGATSLNLLDGTPSGYSFIRAVRIGDSP